MSAENIKRLLAVCIAQARPVMKATNDLNDPVAENSRPNLAYAAGALVLLTLAYALAFVDRQVLTLMVEDIKADLHVSDSAMGLLTGFSFSLFYVVLGLPLARLMDRSVRRNIIAGCVALWSVMTALCGAASSFSLLFLARMGVGCGEAGITPGSASLLADFFPKRLLPTAMGKSVV